MINHIISERSKQAQNESKTTHNWVVKVIHWELCKKLKFDHIANWYMHKLESILENKTRNILRDFEIQTDHLISARRPDLEMINKTEKENLQNSGFCLSGRPKNENQRKPKKRRVLEVCQKTKKVVEHEDDNDNNL